MIKDSNVSDITDFSLRFGVCVLYVLELFVSMKNVNMAHIPDLVWGGEAL